MRFLTITINQLLLALLTISFTFGLASASYAQANGSVVISQIYGGGGFSGATWRYDYVMLFNRTSSTINMSTWSLQYASATGTNWSVLNLAGSSIGAGQYYLIVLGASGVSGTNFTISTPADSIGTSNISATSGKLALMTNQTALTTAMSNAGGGNVMDFVGYGGAASDSEGASNAPGGSNTIVVLRNRNTGNFIDTNVNSANFSVTAAADNDALPRNSSSDNPFGASFQPVPVPPTVVSLFIGLAVGGGQMGLAHFRGRKRSAKVEAKDA